MSDDLGWNCHHAVAVNGETYINLADASASFQYLLKRIAAKHAEIARFRAWRDAINDALTNWLDALTDDDTPKDALRRLIQYEITAALDPAVSQAAANLVSIAWDGALDAVIAQVRQYEGVAYRHGNLPHMDPHECAAQAAREIAASIEAMKDREP